ncbi:hypothetical protein E2C01_062738 [Portunus trituberculatus]|uniref:Uncharacterized protein n=1 Tax=Portunus trituberculatus TaxID=210409 RepID=A0A5B7HEW1_PORTR|nr:hypothetical protein [Portunus trituberculatus]
MHLLILTKYTTKRVLLDPYILLSKPITMV